MRTAALLGPRLHFKHESNLSFPPSQPQPSKPSILHAFDFAFQIPFCPTSWFRKPQWLDTARNSEFLSLSPSFSQTRDKASTHSHHLPLFCGFFSDRALSRELLSVRVPQT